MWTLFCNPHRNNGDSDVEGNNSSGAFVMNKGLFGAVDDENPTYDSHQEGSSSCWSPAAKDSGHRRTDTMTTCPTSDIEDRGFDDDDDDECDFDDGLTLQYSSDGCCSFNSLEFEMLKAHVESKFQNQQINYFGEMSCVSSCSSYGDEAEKEWGDDDDDDEGNADDEQEDQRPVFLWTSINARSSSCVMESSSSDNESSLPLPAIEIDHRFGDSASVVSRFSSSVVDELAASGHGSSVCVVDDVETVEDCESSSSR